MAKSIRQGADLLKQYERQMPFALSRALNHTAEDIQDETRRSDTGRPRT